MKIGDEVLTNKGLATIYNGKYLIIHGEQELTYRKDVNIINVSKTKERKELEDIERGKRIWEGIRGGY